MTDVRFRVTRYSAQSSVVAMEDGLTEDEAIRLTKMATGLPLGGWPGRLKGMARQIIHIAPPLTSDPELPNETIIVEAESDA